MPAVEEPQNFVLKMWQNGFSIDEELIRTKIFFIESTLQISGDKSIVGEKGCKKVIT